MNTYKTVSSVYHHYTSVDNALGLYRHTAPNALDFIDRVIEQMPSQIQRIQTGSGQKLLGVKMQEELRKKTGSSSNQISLQLPISREKLSLLIAPIVPESHK